MSLVRPRMSKSAGQRHLRIGEAVGLDAGGRPANRPASIRAHDQLRRDQRPVAAVHDGLTILEFHRRGIVRYLGQCRQLLGAFGKRGQQIPVFDVVAEGLQPDLGGVETHLGRPQQACGGIDDPHHPQRGRRSRGSRDQTPRVSRAATEPARRAVVR